MAVFGQAIWKGPLQNIYPGGAVHPTRGLVLHIMEGYLDGTDATFRDPSSESSAHFGAGRDGRFYQWVDTNDAAWAIMAGNRLWISIECEGFTNEPSRPGWNVLTAQQIDLCAQTLAWLHLLDGVPLQPTDDVNGTGLGWHGMGGDAWGHPFCPGTPIVQQRPSIVKAAVAYVSQPPTWLNLTQARGAGASRPVLRIGASGTAVAAVQRQLGIADDGVFGPDTQAALIAFQAAHGLEADGIVGPQTYALFP